MRYARVVIDLSGELPYHLPAIRSSKFVARWWRAECRTLFVFDPSSGFFLQNVGRILARESESLLLGTRNPCSGWYFIQLATLLKRRRLSETREGFKGLKECLHSSTLLYPSYLCAPPPFFGRRDLFTRAAHDHFENSWKSPTSSTRARLKD